jgi:hypothetical protein
VLWSVVYGSSFNLLINSHKLILCGVHHEYTGFARAIQSSLHGVGFHCIEDLVSTSGSFVVLLREGGLVAVKTYISALS